MWFRDKNLVVCTCDVNEKDRIPKMAVELKWKRKQGWTKRV